MTMKAFRRAAVFALIATACVPAAAAELRVSTSEQLSDALAEARRGDDIVLAPGVYAGGLFRRGLAGVTIRSADRDRPVIVRGGSFGLQLSDPVDVTLSDLIFERQLDNGLNIDDGGTFDTPARDVRLIRITVRDMVNRGNHDAIKMAGVVGFLIDGVEVRNWGDGGSAIDFVGCRDGLVQNSLLTHRRLTIGGSGIRPKGGSKNIVIRANRVDIPVASGRAIQAGGSTDPEFFRFEDGDKNYEASEITVEGNVVIGGGSAFSWVNIDGGVMHHNLVERPAPWGLRILNENPNSKIVRTQGGIFEDNEVRFETGGAFNTMVNVGAQTKPETFRFARNRWLNLSDPTARGSRPDLPARETDGVYGKPLRNAPDRPQVWTFSWGQWVVNATTTRKSVRITDFRSLRRAVGGRKATFSPRAERPLSGSWRLRPLQEGELSLPAMSQAILIKPEACPQC